MSKKTNNKRDNAEKDDRVVFHALNVAKLKIHPHLLATYEQYVNVLWETNVFFGFDDLTEEQKTALEKIEFEIVYFQEDGLTPRLLFIIDKDYYSMDLKELVSERGDMDFAERIMNCMYSDLGISPDFDVWSD